jgi:sugar O-acyltransferase (sialic acid O-acetyltransferase NeuD family)
MMVDLFIVGAGGLGRGLADALLYDHKENIKEEFENVYFVDDNNMGKYINDIYVKYSIDDFLKYDKECLVINAIGTSRTRKKIQDRLNTNEKFKFPNYIDRDVKLYKNIRIGKGNIITQGVVFSTNIMIGDFNLIHFNCTVGHDVQIGDYNCIYPLTSLSGFSRIGNKNVIGTGSCTLPHSRLSDEIYVGAHSLVKGKHESGITIVGSPAKKLEKNCKE